jgi:hypothetical protein
MTDEELLRIVISEQQRSVGFDLDADLTEQRELSLEYYKGEMRDVPSMPNRSKAVSLDGRDAIQSVIPDIIDIFTTGDDVVAFEPVGPEDEEQAKLETKTLKHVVFNQNPGWLNFYSMFLDALQAKTGIIKWWVEEGEYPDNVEFKNKTAMELEQATQDGSELVEVNPSELMASGLLSEPLYDFTLKPPQGQPKLCMDTVAPEDLTVARDTTVRLADATYCATRSRPRAQDLLAQGVSRDIVDDLPEWVATIDNAVPLARDTVQEGEQVGGTSTFDMRQVEVVEHYIRIREGKSINLYCVLTGGQGASSVLIRKEKVNRIQIAAVTPYLVSHRFYGNSMMDMIMDVQRIKTVLQRMTLDSGYFALNQRHEVADNGSNENTMDDLLNNQPGVPVRVKVAGTVNAIQSPGLNFDTLAHLEYFSTVLEERTGMVRAAQGLNPETLHETKGGMLALLGRAQRRTRMIARTFAETGVKDMYLGVHATLRENMTKAFNLKINDQWVESNPSEWNSRDNMAIEIGEGAGNKEHDVMVAQMLGQVQAQVIEGGYTDIVTPDNIYHAARTIAEKADVKNPDAWFSDPKKAPPKPPQPDPAAMEVQAKAELEQQKLQAQQEANSQKLEQDGLKALGEHDLKQQQLEADTQLRQQQIQADTETKRWQIEQELILKREQLAAELDLKREQMAAELALKREQAVMNAAMSTDIPDGGSDIGNVDVGGEPG